MSSDSSLRTPGTWANGRVLKPEERKRKREIDRAAKRNAAESQKASEVRIQALEQLVVELSGRVVKLETEIASTRPSRTSNLDHVQVKPLAEPIGPLSWLPINTSLESCGLSQPLPVAGNPSLDLQWMGISENCSHVNATDWFTLSHAYAPSSPTLLIDIPTNSSNPTLQSPSRNSPAPHGLNPLNWEQTDKFENILRMLYSLRGTNLVDKDHFANEDLLIRGIVDGWSSVLQTPYGKSCPLWTILSGIDQGLYYNCCAIVRLAHLRKIYRMSMFIIYGTSVPPWLDPNSRPQRYYSQDSISVKDFIPQPQLRDLLKKIHLTNEFWAWFSHCISFNTVLEFSQAYGISRGRYLFSENFTNDFLRLENWKYSGAMIMQFPAIFGQCPLAMGTKISADSYEGHINEYTTDEEAHQFESALMFIAGDCSLGYIHLRPGSGIYYIHGLKTPFVVQNDFRVERHLLYGECFVYGLMDKKAEWSKEDVYLTIGLNNMVSTFSTFFSSHHLV